MKTKNVYFISTKIILRLITICFLTVIFSVNAEEDRLASGKQAYFEQNYLRAAQLLSPLANNGDAEAQYYMGLSLIEKNPDQAFKLLLSAAKQNHQRAIIKIADLYESGTGTTANLLTALDWRQKAKELEIAKAHNILFFNADGQKQSNQQMINQLIELTKITKITNNIDACMQLAKIYDNGMLTKRDMKQSFYWFSKAAELGNKNAMLNLGYFHCRGIGTKENHHKANIWFKQSKRKISCN